MRRVKQRDTAPELLFRAYLRDWGLAYRVCPRGLPGRPDIANRRRRWAVFIHGCFWHGHQGCRLASTPKTNAAFWRQKLAANRARDTRKIKDLEALGFLVVVVWQCELEDARALRKTRAALCRRSQ
jgi:DNA mismatch endonuclease, patch repair protein